MTTLEFQNIREEICDKLRTGNIFSTTIREVTTTTDNFTATAGQTVFTLTNSGVKNIRSLTVAAASKYLFKDYAVNWKTGIVTLSTGATLSDAVAIQYDYGTSDKIFPDMPRGDLSLSSFPRIGISLVNARTEPFGLGGMQHISDVLITVYIWMPINKVSTIAGGIGGTDDLNNYLSDVRSNIRTNAKLFQSFQYITPVGSTPIIVGQNQKIIQASQDFMIKFLVE
jgi:hypothetical protein